MTITLRGRRGLARGLLACAIALGLTLAVAPGAEAGPNGGEGVCVKAYNYADPTAGWLYATADGLAHPDGGSCDNVAVEIGHNSFYHYPKGPGIEGSQCFNATLLSSGSGSSGYSSTAWYGDVDALRKPCSQHLASRYSGYPNESIGALLFQW